MYEHALYCCRSLLLFLFFFCFLVLFFVRCFAFTNVLFVFCFFFLPLENKGNFVHLLATTTTGILPVDVGLPVFILQHSIKHSRTNTTYICYIYGKYIPYSCVCACLDRSIWYYNYQPCTNPPATQFCVTQCVSVVSILFVIARFYFIAGTLTGRLHQL